MPIKKGTTSIGSIYKGTTPIGAIYKGTNLIFESAKWLPYNYEYLYYDLIPTTINSKNVQDKAKVSKIYANGVIENQIMKEYPVGESLGWYVNTTYGTLTLDNGIYTYELTSLSSGAQSINNTRLHVANEIINGHKYLYRFKVKADINTTTTLLFNNSYPLGISLTANVESLYATIITGGSNNRIYQYFGASSFAVGNKISFRDFELTDLTLMFGTGNEPTTIDDNRIKALLNRGYIAYNTGSYKSTDMIEIVDEPYNIWDEQTESGRFDLSTGATVSADNQLRTVNDIEIIAGKQYTMEYTGSASNVSVWAFIFDKNGNIISPASYATIGYVQNAMHLLDASHYTNTFTAPANAKYLRFYLTADYGTTYGNNVCFHFAGTRTGYAPHTETQYISFKYQGNGNIDTHDTLEITSSECVFTKNVIVHRFTGNETIDNLSQFGTNFMGITNFTPNELVPPNNYLPMFNKRVFNKGSINNLPEGYCYTYSRNFYYNIGTNDQQANIDFITGLEMIYQLATPQVIRIPRKHLGVVDLGTLTWNIGSSGYGFASFNIVSNYGAKPTTSNNLMTNIVCSKYRTDTAKNITDQAVDMSVAINTSGSLLIRDTSKSSLTAEQFKTAMSGTYLFYETDLEVADIANKLNIEPGGTLSTTNFEWIRNQQLINGDVMSNSNWTATNCTYDLGILTASSNNHNPQGTNIVQSVSYTTDHVYLEYVNVKTDYQSLGPAFGSSHHLIAPAKIEANTLTTFSRIFIATDDNDFKICMGQVSRDNRMYPIAMLIDLTLAFGAGNEPTDTNDSRIQAIIRNGYIPTDTTGTSVGSNVLQNIDMLFKCK